MTETPITTDRWQQKWDAQLERLKEFVTANGYVPYPRPGQDPVVESIGQWVSKQRKLIRAGKLSQARIDALSTVPDALQGRQYKRYVDEVLNLAVADENFQDALNNAFEEGRTYTRPEIIDVLSQTISKYTANVASESVALEHA